ncbi:aldehyde dehydrogenase (NADP(+)) [Conyzicola nivalis]|uniref:Fatty aldehyde dehydrogenase n=1 Tax=Conyzicola nivalis TaxID=1477021 RepID=A0A916SGJ5_9MICO|nr:aldehyde dehydrogenase (NADP(+)) [Conyzicola nivalis]GGA98032.1 fatty aldehyde dehydrogenase [Conyzicola nivalis]
MTITGEMLIGAERVRGTAGSFRAVDPSTGETVEPDFGQGDEADVDRAALLAHDAFDVYRATSPAQRADFLESIARNIEALGDTLIDRARLESGLPAARLEGERTRTTSQLRLFAELLRGGTSTGVRIDPAQPDRKPAPRLDIRQRLIGVGPVAVFGSSNFPLAFSNAGGDTASALAGGCPVVVKVHNAHPGTAMLVAGAVSDAVAEQGLPEGVYSSLIGAGNSIGAALVAHPAIKAVGFTGSRSGGLALVEIARKRREPIPVYAEMSSINPVFVFPSAITEEVAAGFVSSLTLGAGQFCTNPGLVFVPTGREGDEFTRSVGRLVAEATGQTMLTRGIREAFESGTARLDAVPGVERLGSGAPGDGPNAPGPVVFATDSDRLRSEDALQDEVFGASSLVVRYGSIDDLLALAEAIEGQLTATILAGRGENGEVSRLLPVLERKVGRILYNGWPTGVEVNHAMVHGGPFPSTSDGKTTSVGTLAIQRFLRPVAYQNLPDELLPAPLADANPWDQVRSVDGRIEGLTR